MIDSTASEEPVERYINKLALSLGRSKLPSHNDPE
jgi:hypothetical protein